MPVRVVTQSGPIVAPEDIPGATEDDTAIAAIIRAATEDIDGPGGWLGRALGPQTLELTAAGFSEIARCGVIRLPYPPLISVLSVKYLDARGIEQTLDPASYRVNETSLMLSPGETWPATNAAVDAVRVRFRAGYNGVSGAAVGENQTGSIPERARQAIILMAQDARRIGQSGGMVRSEAIEDVRTVSYVDADRTSELSNKAAARLLAGLRVYTL